MLQVRNGGNGKFLCRLGIVYKGEGIIVVDCDGILSHAVSSHDYTGVSHHLYIFNIIEFADIKNSSADGFFLSKKTIAIQ